MTEPIVCHGTYKGLRCDTVCCISNVDDRLVVHVRVSRCLGKWHYYPGSDRRNDRFYRGNCSATLVSELGGGWPPGSWEMLAVALEECYAFVNVPFTAKEAGLA